MNKNISLTILLVLNALIIVPLKAQEVEHSVAREWNEALLHSIRNDFARPTVHARNLWHVSFAMYDAWAAYTPAAETYFLGNNISGFQVPFNGVQFEGNRQEAQEEAISYAAYRLLKHRFEFSPNPEPTNTYLDSLIVALGYDPGYTSTDYAKGIPAAFGNYIAEQVIAFGHQDSANEQGQYANQYYEPANPPLVMASPGNPDIVDPNRWQPLSLDVYIDQSGNIIPGGTADCLSPEWGEVVPFSLNENDLTLHYRDGHEYKVYHDPGPPPMIDTVNGGVLSDQFRKYFTMVAKWQAHLDTADGVMWDISPASIGNIPWYPSTVDSFDLFYDYENGGDNSLGHAVNPYTGQPYAPQMVHRADYARVLAEFWADGPDSETPPGHWFTLLNWVTDHPQHQNKWMGQGPVLDPLEWDVKTYFTLGGTMHDVAIACWGIKGWYDFVRPVSAIRYMADQGQSSDPNLPNYSINGLELEPGFIEMVDSLDPIAGSQFQNVGKVKIKTWMGPDFVLDPAVDQAGVDWILAENWWSFQRPSFVAPPFPGFMSGHSTYSRAAAEIMEMMTGDPFFPGGMGEFLAKQNDFLFFEEGPSQDVILQWATYRDASDQCSLSRIWGGIHPPLDDMIGRFIGEDISDETWPLANSYWLDNTADLVNVLATPHHVNAYNSGETFYITLTFDEPMNTSIMPSVTFPDENPMASYLSALSGSTGWQDDFTYQLAYEVTSTSGELLDIDVAVDGAEAQDGDVIAAQTYKDLFNVDFETIEAVAITASADTLKREDKGSHFSLVLEVNEPADKAVSPTFELESGAEISLHRIFHMGGWQDDVHFEAVYVVDSVKNELAGIDVTVSGYADEAGNVGTTFSEADLFSIDIDWPLGIASSEVKNVVNAFPNPVRSGGIVNLHFADAIKGDFQVINANGQVVGTKKINGRDVVTWNTSGLAPGNYVLRLDRDDMVVNTSVIITK